MPTSISAGRTRGACARAKTCTSRVTSAIKVLSMSCSIAACFAFPLTINNAAGKRLRGEKKVC